MGFAVCPGSDVVDWRLLRGAVRYPLNLRVTLVSEGRTSEAVTQDLSASGVLFQVSEPMRQGQQIEFLLEIPAGVLDHSSTAAVHCTGKIVRFYRKGGAHFAAAVIEDYRFQ